MQKTIISGSDHCLVWAAALSVLVLGALLPTTAPAASTDRMIIYTVNYPLKYFAERIAGEHADVVFPAPADGDPAFWCPLPTR